MENVCELKWPLIDLGGKIYKKGVQTPEGTVLVFNSEKEEEDAILNMKFNGSTGEFWRHYVKVEDENSQLQTES